MDLHTNGHVAASASALSACSWTIQRVYIHQSWDMDAGSNAIPEFSLISTTSVHQSRVSLKHARNARKRPQGADRRRPHTPEKLKQRPKVESYRSCKKPARSYQVQHCLVI